MIKVKLNETNLAGHTVIARGWALLVLRGVWRAFLTGAATYGTAMYGLPNLEDLRFYIADRTDNR